MVIKRLRICNIYIALNIVALRLILAHLWSCGDVCVVLSRNVTTKANNHQTGCWLFIAFSKCGYEYKYIHPEIAFSTFNNDVVSRESILFLTYVSSRVIFT